MTHLSRLDFMIFIAYFLVIAFYGTWIYRSKNSKLQDSKDYFLAEGSLTWWAIGASLIASNISAEQFIGMSGSGFKMGLAIASYEWVAAVTLLVVGAFFIPVYLKNKIYTMPQFLNLRYNGVVSMIMAVFWLLLYVVVNLTSILYLGALAINSISGISLTACMYGLAIFAVIITLGGMKVIGYTDVIQVFFLVLGGLTTTYIALLLVSKHFHGNGFLDGLSILEQKAPGHFKMIFAKNNQNYMDLPGLTVLLGGMWISNLSYWGCNQYITQRALGASLKTARSGLLFAAFLKIMMPVIVVLPGIAAYVLYNDGVFGKEMFSTGELNPDRAYPVLLNLLPPGLKGVSFAALTAAVVASLAGKANSIATIFTLDIYKKQIVPGASEIRMVSVGRITVVIAMLLAIIIAPQLGIDKKGGFQYIQEYTGFVSPGILSMFLLGFFWKGATSRAAIFATVGGFAMSVLLKFLPQKANLSFFSASGFSKANEAGIYEIPFLDRMEIVFVFCVLGMVIISKIERKNGAVPKSLAVEKSMFRLSTSFIAGSLIILGILTALYTIYW